MLRQEGAELACSPPLDGDCRGRQLLEPRELRRRRVEGDAEHPSAESGLLEGTAQGMLDLSALAGSKAREEVLGLKDLDPRTRVPKAVDAAVTAGAIQCLCAHLEREQLADELLEVLACGGARPRNACEILDHGRYFSGGG